MRVLSQVIHTCNGIAFLRWCLVVGSLEMRDGRKTLYDPCEPLGSTYSTRTIGVRDVVKADN